MAGARHADVRRNRNGWMDVYTTQNETIGSCALGGSIDCSVWCILSAIKSLR